MPNGLHERVSEIMGRGAWSEALDLLRAHEAESWENAHLAWDRGWVHAQREEWPDAQRWLRRAVELEPKQATFWASLAVPLDELGELEEAERCNRTALSKGAGPLTRLQLSLVLMKQDRFDEAEQVHLEGLRRHPKHPDLLRYYADFLEDAGRLDEAARYAQLAREAGWTDDD